MPQLPAVVPLVMWTTSPAPAARGKLPQSSVWGGPATIEQVAGPDWVASGQLMPEAPRNGADWLAIDQLIPVPPGSGSVRVVPVEAPGPALLSVIVKPIVFFNETATAEIYSLSLRVALPMFSEAEALPLPSLPEVKLAVLL